MHIDRLAEELKNIVAQHHNSEGVSEHWREKCDSLMTLAKSDNPRNFLRWPPIRETMHDVNRTTFTQYYTSLLEIPNFRERWETGIQDTPVGNPIPFVYDRNNSPVLIQQNYHLALYEKVMGKAVTDVNLVVEIGGGYGSMCRLFYQLGYRGKYLIFDIPPFSVLQELYLTDLGRDVVRQVSGDWTEVWTTFDHKDIETALDGPFKDVLFLATWSLSEMPLTQREKVTKRLDAYSQFLIAFQAEMSGVDNNAYFEAFLSVCPSGIQWKKLETMMDNYYLFG